MDRRNRVAILVVGLLLAASLTSCGDDAGDRDSADQGIDPGDSALPVVEVPARWATGQAKDLPSLIDATGTVFAGQVTALREQREEDVIPTGLSGFEGRGSASLPISLFDVTVERSLLGGLQQGSTVTFEQGGGVVTSSDGSEVQIVLEGDQLLVVGQRYLFFAETNDDGSLSAPPYGRLTVGPDDRLTSLSQWAQLGALQQLSGLRIEDAAREVNAAAPN